MVYERDTITVPPEGGVIVFDGYGGVGSLVGDRADIEIMSAINSVIQHISSGDYIQGLTHSQHVISEIIDSYVDHRTSEETH